MKFTTGVYQIRNVANDQVYVGGAYSDFRSRKGEHCYALDHGSHFNRHLQRAWDKYGRESFAFEILERCAPEEVLKCEQKWLDRLRPYDEGVGYNICFKAGSTLGVRYTEEGRANVSEALKRAYAENPEYRERVRRTNLGRIHTAESKATNSAAQKKRFIERPGEAERFCAFMHTPEAKAKSTETRRARAKKLREDKERAIAQADAEILASRPLGSSGRSEPSRVISQEGRAKLREAVNRPEVRERKAAAARKQWEDEGHRAYVAARNRKANKEQFADPEKRAKHKAAMEAWAIRTYGSVEAWKEFTRERNRRRAAERKAKSTS